MSTSVDRLRKSSLILWVKARVRQADDVVATLRRAALPSAPRYVLFEVRNLFGFAAQAPVVKALLSRDRVRVDVSSITMSHSELERLLEHHEVPTHLIRPPAAARHRRYDLIALTDMASILVWRSSKRFFIHHGSSFGNIADPFSILMIKGGCADYVGCLSAEEEKQLVTTMGEEIRERLVLTGAPKLDALVGGEYDRAAFLVSLGLDPNRKTILLSSHWTPHSLYRTCDLQALRDFLIGLDVNVLVTAHYSLFEKSSERYSGGIDWETRLKCLFNGPTMRVLTRTTDNRELMWAADLFIGDHSSQHVEYASLFRPMIVFVNPSTPLGDRTHQALLAASTHVVHDVADIPAHIVSAIELPSIDAVARRRLMDYCFAYLGRSAPRIADAIESIVIDGQRPGTPKRLQ